MSWNPDLYLAFSDHRLRPALDLVARISLEGPRRIVDLGCGPGHVTKLLAERWPEAETVGIDNAPAMLERARHDFPALAFRLSDIATWRAEPPVDLIFTNAALHWLDDHDHLFPRLLAQLNPGGVLAAQMPRNDDAPCHRALGETAEAGPWRAKLAPLLRRAPVWPPAAYWRLLAPLTQSLDIWESEYLHALCGEDPVAEWTKATALMPFLEALAGAERSAFEAAYRARLRQAYPREADGRTLFPFRRLFIVARR